MSARGGPYQGLVPYGEDDAAYFFGRDTACEFVLGNLLAYRLSVLYGRSGVGKSSALRAGVARRVREEGRLRIERDEAPEFAAVVFSSWAEDPLAGLEAAIRDALEQLSPQHAGGLPDGSLMDVVSAAAERIDGSLLIVLDQFEEYFLYHGATIHEPGSFVDELVRAVARPHAGVRVLISIREDALAELDKLARRLPGLLDNLVRIDHLDRAAARAAIEGPLAQWNRADAESGQQVSIEPELVEAVLDGVGRMDDAGAMSIQTPFLQLVLTRLWDEELKQGSKVMRLRTLTRLQGPERIVATHLDEVMATLTPYEQGVAARVLRHLVTPSGTKIALRTSDLAEYAELDERAVTAVLERLTREARILQPIGESRYEIYHDALAAPILEWRRRWQERQDRARERRRIRILASIAGGLSLILAIVVVLALVAVHQSREAKRQERVAMSVALTSLSRDALADDPDAALLLALEALRVRPRHEARSALVAARQATSGQGAIGILRGHTGGLESVAFSPDGQTLASAGRDRQIRIWDAATNRTGGPPLTSRGSDVRSVAFSPDGRTLAAADGGSRQVRLWDVTARGRVRSLTGHAAAVTSVAFAPDGRVLASGGEDRTVRLWNVETGRQIGRAFTRHKDWVNSVAFSPDGRAVASAAADGRIWLSDVRTGRSRGTALRATSKPVNGVAFSPDGATLAAAGGDGRVRLWDVRTRRALQRPLTGHTDAVAGVAFSRDGRWVASGGVDGRIWVWDVRTRRALGPPFAVSKPVGAVAFGRDGRTLASAGADAKVWLWDVATPRVLRGHGNAVNGVTFSSDGRVLASGGYDSRIRLWNAATGRALRRTLAAAGVTSVAFGPRGRTLAAGGEDGRLRLWDARTGRRLGPDPPRHSGAVSGLAFSPDGRLLASGGVDDPRVRLWDVRARRPSGRPLRGHDGGVFAVAFSPGGSLLASAGADRKVTLWHMRTRRRMASLSRHADVVNGVAFSPDGATLASGGEDGRIWLWDVGRRRARGLAMTQRDAPVRAVAFGPDGRTVVSAGFDGTVRLWDVEAHRPLGPALSGHDGPVTGVAVSPGGRTIASSGTDSTVRLWRRILWRDQARLREEICGLVGAGLSAREWAQFADEIAYRRSCP